MLSIEHLRYLAKLAETRTKDRRYDPRPGLGLEALAKMAGMETSGSHRRAPTGQGFNGWRQVFTWLAHYRTAEPMLVRMSYRTAVPQDVWAEAHREQERRS